MDLERGLALPALGAFAGLLLSLLAFADLPLLGGLAGGLLSGAVAGLLAERPRDAARAGLAAGAGVVAVLIAMTLAGGTLVRGSPLLAVPPAVALAEAALLGLLPGPAAALVALAVTPRLRRAPPPPPAPPPAEPPPAGP